MPGFEQRHLEEPLRCSGLVDNIDKIYFGDYANSDDALMNYCLQKKPQVVLLSIQYQRTKNAPPSPATIRKITYEFGIPTVMFWFDIHDDVIAGILKRYLHSINLNMILGADSISHKTLPLKGTNYVYAGITFDERLFNHPEGERNIPVGFLGSLNQNRSQWIDGLMKSGISVYTAGGFDFSTDKPASVWMPYKEYLALMSRLKIVLNFSMLGCRKYNPIVLSERGRVLEAIWWLVSGLKTYSLTLAKNPLKAKHAVSVFKNAAKSLLLLKKPRYQVRARVWEALWCRTFLLEEDNSVTSLYFEPYVDYVPFTTLKDLADKIRYYLEHDEERDRIRLKGRATVEKYHNARIYWENLFEAIGLQSGAENHHPGEIWNKAYLDRWYLRHPSA
jgi:hypothetical protein